MQITTLPVYSKLADERAIPPEIAGRLPAGWQLSQHQLETYRALMSDDVNVVINTAMTGDGKSLAGQLPLLVDRREILTLYPTNELIQDQLANAGGPNGTLAGWQRPARWVGSVDAAILDARQAEREYARRGDLFLELFGSHKLLLSNPDIFHYILQFCYQQPGRANDWLASRLGVMFQQLTFDEFHIFDLPQVAAVLTGLLFLAEQTAGRIKTLFLSATPDTALLPLLNRAGFRICLVDMRGSYSHGSDPGPAWRPILHCSEIHFEPLRAEAWVEQHLDDILLPFFRQRHPAAKGAIIVGSVAAAQRLYRRLKAPFEQEGLTVLPNTGLTARADRRDAYAADLLIGTSTIDVGVDFQINFLVFEASETGNFLQRLGRLGRHAGYTRNGVFHRFDDFQAYALVPEFVHQRLFDGYSGEAPLLTNGSMLTREELRPLIERAFPPPTTFPAYLRRWGRFVPANVIANLASPPIRDAYAGIREQLQARYEQTFNISLGKTWGAGKRLKDEGRELLVKEAQAFRGGSPFAAAVLTPNGRGEFTPQTYDLFWLLANAELDLLDEESFLATLPPSSLEAAAIKRAQPCAYLRLRDYRTERSDLLIRLPPAIADWDATRQQNAQVLQGIKVELTGPPWLNELNRRLVPRKVIGLIIPGLHPLDVARRLRLPLLFPVYRYEDTNGVTGSIAFARQALLLDTALYYRPLDTGLPAAPFIY